MTPATVPVCTPASLDPLTDPAGTVMRAVLPPVEKTIEGSSPPVSGANVSVRVTTTSTGNVAPRATVSRGCCTGLAVAVMPAKLNGGVAGNAITMLNTLLVLAPVLSRTVTVTLDVPGAAG